MVKVSNLAIACAGLLATAAIGTQGALAAPDKSYKPGETYTVTGRTPSSDVSVAVVPSGAYTTFSGRTDDQGSFSFSFPEKFSSGEYTVFASEGDSCYKESSTLTVSSSVRRNFRPRSEYEHSHSSHENSDYGHPQQHYGGCGTGGCRESITAIATNGAGSSAGAQIGLVTLASFLGALALF